MRTLFSATILALLAVGALGPLAVSGFQGTPDATPNAEPVLTPVVWQWATLELADGSSQSPDDSAKYTIQFRPDGHYDLRIDCNSGGGEYTVDGSMLQLGVAMTTLIACPPGTLDTVFLPPLEEVVAFAYEGEELVLALANDAGVMRFAPSLTGVVWQWQGFQGSDSSEVVPDDPARYTVQFLDDGTVAAQVDCNSGSGSYAATDGQLAISQLATTLMACPPDSLDADFARILDEAVSYVFREGKLYLALPADAGVAEFAATVAVEDGATPAAG